MESRERAHRPRRPRESPAVRSRPSRTGPAWTSSSRPSTSSWIESTDRTRRSHMESARPVLWRTLFVMGGLLYFVGAFYHPRGMTMTDMLVDPAWLPSHAGVFVGLLAMTAGLMLVLAVLETIEMGLHAMAYVDA